MTAVRCALAAMALASAPPPEVAAPGRRLAADEGDARQESFAALLRTYADRRPQDSLSLAERLVEAGPFAEHDRAEYWIGNVRLSLGDRDGAAAWFGRLSRDHPDSPWAGRGQLGLADIASEEHRYGAAVAIYARAAGDKDAVVRERARIRSAQVLALRARQRRAWAAAAFALAWVSLLVASVVRLRARVLPLPAELRIAGPVLVVLALFSLRQEPAPRAAVLEVAAAGAVLATVSGLRLRAVAQGPCARGLHAALTVAALFACAYAAACRNELVGSVLETFRAGAE